MYYSFYSSVIQFERNIVHLYSILLNRLADLKKNKINIVTIIFVNAENNNNALANEQNKLVSILKIVKKTNKPMVEQFLFKRIKKVEDKWTMGTILVHRQK